MRAHRTKTLLFVAVSGVLALALLISDQYLPGLPLQPKQLPAAVVTMGDSTLSGEGGGDYAVGTNGERGNWCHRSAAAPIHQLQLPPDVTRINLACSGARAEVVGADPDPGHAEGSQSAQLAELAKRYRITDVVVQVGANDVGFTDTVNQCVEAWVRRAEEGCAGQLRSDWPRRIERMQPKVRSALEDIRAAMDSAGYTPSSYSLVVQSYASPVGPDVRPELQNLSGCPFLTSDLQWIRDTGVPQLANGLHEVAQQVGARFLDHSRAGSGREACTGDPKTGEGEWFTRLSVDWASLQDESRAAHAMQESYHANAAGHRQLGRCLSEFLATTEETASCLPDDRGNLHLATNTASALPSHP
ncbi:GDSL-like Lipase/Acylhydrolase family protein [Saccharopolyspora kobensis]|uniref:GDSL-like Lipase/Acylhydrolase family protein n=1 Tax=Saccharopolyspora kobensis TaxID=146035 RepID=A0A1H5TEB1_9PSEU|nr:GDSL-like Lipase/Acylhydrolase family protein [Saccharopolyspora kobensis]SFC47251.1 GDSL-like Lipase/Acylhydrolase family protein [Saccharopolyspora kobensis]